LDKLLDAALGACDSLFAAQRKALELPYPGLLPDGSTSPKAFGT
jgi:ribonuclease PH